MSKLPVSASATEGAPLVLQIVTRMAAGGVPTQVAALLCGMPQRGYSIVLAVGHTCSNEEDMSYLLRNDDPVVHIPCLSRAFSPAADLRATWRLLRLIRELRPNIVHTHTAKAGLLGRIAARLMGVPVVIHTFHGNVLSGYFSEPVSVTIRFVERLLAKLTDGITVVSPQQADEIVARFRIAPAGKVHVLPVGLDLSDFAILDPPSLRAGLLTVGWFGRLVPVKNVPLLLQAVAATCRRTDRIRFLVAGDGPERPLVEAAARKWGNARLEFVGWQKSVVPLIDRCHVVLQTSRNEGTPGALIQAMAARRPFVSTAAGGVVDLVSGSPRETASEGRWYRNGVLVEDDPNPIYRALRRLADSPNLVLSMGQAGHAFAMEHFPNERMAENTARIYDQLLTAKAARRELFDRDCSPVR